MKISSNNIIGELVAQDYRTAAIFKSNGIDFCCNGNRSISDACAQQALDTEQLVQALQKVMISDEAGNVDYKSWPADLLADYIEKKHHRYVENKIPEIKPYLQKIVRVHGKKHPELIEIEKLFLESAGELAAHMKKEELILFPFIRKIFKAKQNGEVMETSRLGSVENPVAMMMHEHEHEGDRFRRIAELSNNYTPPADACGTYQVTFALLKEFEEDLHLHIHLENNILFPEAVAMEKSMTTS